MGKKIPILISILTLLGNSALGVSAFAEQQGPWTFEEMNLLNQEAEALKDEQCLNSDDPFMCYISYRWGGENQQQYEALSAFNENSFTITAINPSKNTIRVYFNSENVTAKHMGSHNYISDISDLFIAQFDVGYSGEVSYYVRNKVENPHMHLLFSGFELVKGEGWLPSNTEVEIQLDGISLSDDINQKLYVSYTDSTLANYGLQFNYASCINSPDYQEGMECQARYLRFDEPLFYVPVIPEEPIIETDAQDIPTPNDSETSPYGDEGYGNVSDDATDATAALKAPNTGIATEECVKKVDFPWWLMALIVLGDAIVIWWFIPVRRRK